MREDMKIQRVERLKAECMTESGVEIVGLDCEDVMRGVFLLRAKKLQA